MSASKYEVHAFAGDPDAQRVQRVMRAPPGSKPVAEAEEVFLVDRVQHRRRRPLDDLVLQRGDRQRSLSSVRLGYVDPPARRRPIRSPMDPRMQVLELAPEVAIRSPPTSVRRRPERRSSSIRRTPLSSAPTVMWCRSAVNFSFFLSLAVSRTRSRPWDAPSRLGVRSVPACSAFPLVPALGSTGSAAGRPALFVGFTATDVWGLTPHARSSSATAPRLPDADRARPGRPARHEASQVPTSSVRA